MKATFPTFRLVAALGLAGGMMIGCQDLLNSGTTANSTGATTADQGVLSLSIKNDSSCQGEWHAILDARSAGHPDSASEAAFLATCVTEVKPEKDKPMPVVPPPLVPDSGTRCKWIAAQISGGRDSLSVSYLKYCPDDCRKLEATDSASHEKMCREPKPHGIDSLPPKHGDDSLPPKPHGDDSLPPKPHNDDSLPHPPKPMGDTAKLNHDTCDMLKEKLEAVKPGEAGRADLEAAFKARCNEPLPHDTSMVPPPKPHGDSLPPPPKPIDDTCKMLMEKLESVKPGEPGRADLEAAFKARCPEPIPHDTSATLPPPPKPIPHDSLCLVLKTQLAVSAPGSAGHADLEAAFKAQCQESTPVQPPPVNCDELRLKLSSLDSTSVDYANLAATLKERCPVVPVK